VSYYGSIKNTIVNQWGYSYETLDTGYQYFIKSWCVWEEIFFIGKFAYTKSDWVKAPDDSDILWWDRHIVSKSWHLQDLSCDVTTKLLYWVIFISYKAHSFDCSNEPPPGTARTFMMDFFIYLRMVFLVFYYLQCRLALNNREGDYCLMLAQVFLMTGFKSLLYLLHDNTYNYNVMYSKQNRKYFYSFTFRLKEDLV
jgi:hypothetical protein